jgi:hypothetical protein
MIDQNASHVPWLAPVAAALEVQGGNGAFLVLFDTYRPDLVRAMAHAFSMGFIDFRVQYMQPLGHGAGGLPLARINEVIAQSHQESAGLPGLNGSGQKSKGIVLHNVEALLATRGRDKRIAWMAEFIEMPVPAPVLIPLAVFADEAAQAHPRVVRIDTSGLPQEKLLFRLARQ